MLILASLCAVYAYEQRLKAAAQRNEVIELHRQIKELTDESAALKLEANKLRLMMESRERDFNQKIDEMETKQKK
jgi:regulator of replication initiation timing